MMKQTWILATASIFLVSSAALANFPTPQAFNQPSEQEASPTFNELRGRYLNEDGSVGYNYYTAPNMERNRVYAPTVQIRQVATTPALSRASDEAETAVLVDNAGFALDRAISNTEILIDVGINTDPEPVQEPLEDISQGIAVDAEAPVPAQVAPDSTNPYRSNINPESATRSALGQFSSGRRPEANPDFVAEQPSSEPSKDEILDQQLAEQANNQNNNQEEDEEQFECLGCEPQGETSAPSETVPATPDVLISAPVTQGPSAASPAPAPANSADALDAAGASDNFFITSGAGACSLSKQQAATHLPAQLALMILMTASGLLLGLRARREI